MQNSTLSRLSQLVPSVGVFFTPLPLSKSFSVINSKRSIASRRHVAPSFNDVRYILNYAQVYAIASSLKLVTFDGDMTLYQDGANFSSDSILVGLIVALLAKGITVSIGLM